MKYEFMTSSIQSQFIQNLSDRYCYSITEDRTAEIYQILFESFAKALVAARRDNRTSPRIGLRVIDDKGNFKFGAILNYNAPEESNEDDHGSYYLEFTFYEEDMKDLDFELDNHSTTYAMALQASSSEHSARFTNIQAMFEIIDTALDTLRSYLDINAKEDEVIDLIFQGVFTASVGIEDGKKVFSIVPGETVKQIVKDDKFLS